MPKTFFEYATGLAPFRGLNSEQKRLWSDRVCLPSEETHPPTENKHDLKWEKLLISMYALIADFRSQILDFKSPGKSWIRYFS